MNEYSIDTVQGGSERRETDAPPPTGSAPGPAKSSAVEAVNPMPAAGIDGPSISAENSVPEGASNDTAPEASSTAAETANSPGSDRARIVRVSGIKEIGWDGKSSRITSWKPPFEVQKGFEASFAEIIERTELARAPLNAIPLPTGSASFGTTAELFSQLQNAIAAEALVPAPTSALLSFWILSTWFSDGLSFAPGLVIVGPAFEGNLVLRTLRNFCRYPLMLTRADISSLQKVSWESAPTLLFFDPNVSKQMASVLTCSTSRGYLVGTADGYKDFFGPKAVFIGEEAPLDRTPRGGLRVNLQPTIASGPRVASSISESTVQNLQNQLMMYRQKNLVNVYHSEYDATGLTSETRAIAIALGSCIVDAPALQSELITLLMPCENERQADRSTCLEAITLEATLNLAHAGKAQILVGEIAREVNRIVKARGELLHYSAESIGHRLKKIGLVTRRLGKSGNGLVMDLATMIRVHELANAYGGVGLDPDEKSLKCPICTENQ